ncbi:hypothetical protein BDY21DRAFT_385201 [Lineolata rhizophorae]|uniref:Cytidylyltransferase family-domain-containing protein n=1 Tax=Lineolata rhizophorae TaxID=578093 RepID=A0A6A6P4N0_9PEZI|nr:hypothetical protein BDY21DRAFT_385201 [Lineolata rhizophorae]
MAAASTQIPSTPRVISPSPTPSETPSRGGVSSDDYFGPVTRSAARRRQTPAPETIAEYENGSISGCKSGGRRKGTRPQVDGAADGSSSGSDPDKRARARSRSPMVLMDGQPGRRRRMSGLTATTAKAKAGKEKLDQLDGTAANGSANGSANGHLSPASAGKSYWRSISRSPSPLGLIPIHKEWRSFIHRHEIPRKVLHVSIGFLTLWLYARGSQPSSIHPVLLAALIPIASIDLLRHHWAPFNALYVRVLGALMRESEVDGYNGVIWYLAGAWAVLRLAPKDVAVVSVLLLSWCDTAASTFGRLWGRYTPRVRRGKSLAGSVAACAVGVATALLFWGAVAPAAPPGCDAGANAFEFRGSLRFPGKLGGLLGCGEAAGGTLEGGWALGVVSVWAGLVASVSEAVDVFGWDDNLTIPVLCGAGLWGFFKVFG